MLFSPLNRIHSKLDYPFSSGGRINNREFNVKRASLITIVLSPDSTSVLCNNIFADVKAKP
jgi:hypothetical protein